MRLTAPCIRIFKSVSQSTRCDQLIIEPQ
uniref:Uncharacterized protein n=1 Tax=Anguilla anguilla TaxID=7936 RepID=A0A0E9SFT6_ANGAN